MSYSRVLLRKLCSNVLSHDRGLTVTLFSIVSFHHNLDTLHIIIANGLVEALGRNINLFVHFQFFVQLVFGKDDILVILTSSSFLHLRLLDLPFQSLSSLCLFFKLNLLCEEGFLEASPHRLFLSSHLFTLLRLFLRVVI